VKKNKRNNIEKHHLPKEQFPYNATIYINGKRYTSTNEDEFRILSHIVAGISPRPLGYKYSFLTRLRALITNDSKMIKHIAGEDQINYERAKESELILKMRRNGRKNK
jgi:hypothetical protein